MKFHKGDIVVIKDISRMRPELDIKEGDRALVTEVFEYEERLMLKFERTGIKVHSSMRRFVKEENKLSDVLS